MIESEHFNQPQRRDAKFVKPRNILKAKVGSGGLDDKILDRAQGLIDNTTVDFPALAEAYLSSMMDGIKTASDGLKKGNPDSEGLISGILYPCMQIKGNGGMFGYPAVSRVADIFVRFMEAVEKADKDVLDIALAFHKSIKLVLVNKRSGEGDKFVDNIAEELDKACTRYFEKKKSSHG